MISVSLRITGQFSIPVNVIIEVSDGTATGETLNVICEAHTERN